MEKKIMCVKRKRALPFLLLLLIITTTSALIAEEVIRDEKLFLQKFTEALEAKDQNRMEELVKQAGPDIAFNVVISLSDYGVNSLAEEKKEGIVYFDVAEVIAATYAKVFKKEGLVELVRKYKQYTPEMCKGRSLACSAFFKKAKRGMAISPQSWKVNNDCPHPRNQPQAASPMRYRTIIPIRLDQRPLVAAGGAKRLLKKSDILQL